MNRITRITLALFVSMTLGFPMASLAQTPIVNTANVAAECEKSAALCEAAVAAAIATLRALNLSAAALNTQLGVLAGAAFDGAKSLPATEKVALARTLDAISATSTNERQKVVLAEVARLLRLGQPVDLVAVAREFSPS